MCTCSRYIRAASGQGSCRRRGSRRNTRRALEAEDRRRGVTHALDATSGDRSRTRLETERAARTIGVGQLGVPASTNAGFGPRRVVGAVVARQRSRDAAHARIHARLDGRSISLGRASSRARVLLRPREGFGELVLALRVVRRLALHLLRPLIGQAIGLVACRLVLLRLALLGVGRLRGMGWRCRHHGAPPAHQRHRRHHRPPATLHLLDDLPPGCARVSPQRHLGKVARAGLIRRESDPTHAHETGMLPRPRRSLPSEESWCTVRDQAGDG
jgi:hypothetical protein